MHSRDYRDIVGGLLLLAIGLFMVWEAYARLNLGTLARLGSGAFPMGIGVSLVGFGIAIIVPALFRSGRLDPVEWRSAISVVASVVVFGLLTGPFGLVPAIIGLILVSSLAERKLRPVALLALCIVLPLMAYLTFRVGLGLPITMLRWPF